MTISQNNTHRRHQTMVTAPNYHSQPINSHSPQQGSLTPIYSHSLRKNHSPPAHVIAPDNNHNFPQPHIGHNPWQWSEPPPTTLAALHNNCRVATDPTTVTALNSHWHPNIVLSTNHGHNPLDNVHPPNKSCSASLIVSDAHTSHNSRKWSQA